jgi:biopolymer transport protein ExbB
MWPIALCSVVALAIILERAWFLLMRASRIAPRSFLREMEAILDTGKIEEAVVACRKNNSLMAQVLLSALNLYGSPRERIREALEDEGRRAARELERFLPVLAAIPGLSTLLGFLGTVMGMIQIFEQISQKHIGQMEYLASGIYVALYTTAFGLIVAVPAYFAYRGFSGIAERDVREMEDFAVDLLNHLDKGAAAKAGPEKAK